MGIDLGEKKGAIRGTFLQDNRVRFGTDKSFAQKHILIWLVGVRSEAECAVVIDPAGPAKKVRQMQTNFLGFILVFMTAVPSFAYNREAEIATQNPLPQLVANRFGELSLAEKKLVNAAANGETADCSELSGKGHIIRGDLLSWLCTNADASAEVTFRGIAVIGAEIVNKVDLEWAKISFPITALQCLFKDAIILSHSHIGSLDLSGSSVQELQAVATHCEGDIYLREGFKAEGRVNLIAAKIDGNLAFDGGQFISVDLTAAKIDGNLECDGGQFISQGETAALNVNGAEVKGSVFLGNGFKAEGGVDLTGVEIDGNLECDGGQFVGNDKVPALDANDAEIKGSVRLRDPFKAEGEVNLLGAKIDGSLVCDGGQFVGNDKVLALYANGAEVKGSVDLRNPFKGEGGVNLVAAKIGQNLECDGGQFIGNNKVQALNVNSAEVKGSVFLRGGFKAEGGVNLLGAKIDGSLVCDGGQFIGNAKVPALNANGSKIEGSAYLRNGFKAEGTVVFFNGYVGRSFQLTHVESPEKAILDLRLTKFGTLANLKDSWPTPGNLLVDGSVYDQIDDLASPNAEVQLGWLKRQPQDRFLSQPFEQLAIVLRKMGLEEDARAVMIAKNEEHARYIQWRPEWLWYGLFGQIIGYGYSPWRAFELA